jgi:hypothetical protein
VEFRILLNLTVAKIGTKVTRQRINPDALDGLRVATEGVKFAASLRVTEILTVGGFVASSGEAWFFNERFQQRPDDRRSGCASHRPSIG